MQNIILLFWGKNTIPYLHEILCKSCKKKNNWARNIKTEKKWVVFSFILSQYKYKSRVNPVTPALPSEPKTSEKLTAAPHHQQGSFLMLLHFFLPSSFISLTNPNPNHWIVHTAMADETVAIPVEVDPNLNEVKLFNQWSFDDVQVFFSFYHFSFQIYILLFLSRIVESESQNAFQCTLFFFFLSVIS